MLLLKLCNFGLFILNRDSIAYYIYGKSKTPNTYSKSKEILTLPQAGLKLSSTATLSTVHPPCPKIFLDIVASASHVVHFIEEFPSLAVRWIDLVAVSCSVEVPHPRY